ncbi:alpha/beta hydrolase family protein [Brevundimonas sp. FT23028]|uniref:alpha/beta hydrolase family protein n=1 Tax=Brevundimonas sp. FT23028 TaxID=3393748 RepID=UPI003B58961D
MTILSPILAAVVAVAPAQASPDITGAWEGRISVGGQSIRIVFNVAADGATTMDSPDQGARGIPATSAVEGRTVRFTVPAIGGRFEGLLADDGRSLTGALAQGGMNVPLVMQRGEIAAGASRPQTPQPPFPYRSEEVVVPTPTPGVQLAGTLAVPEGAGPFPAVLLITGSGQQDRDETVFDHKPFLVLADALSRRGVAVLRVDDPGVGGSTDRAGQSTTADFAVDAGAAFDWLVARPETADTRVGLLGHSEGGTIAPMVAQTDPRVAFVVLLAGPSVRGAEVMTEQSRRMQTAARIDPAVVDGNVAIQARIMAAIAAHPDDGDGAARAVRDSLSGVDVPPQLLDQAAGWAATDWARWFIAHDPQPSLRALRVPVLAIYGGKDVQVPAEQNATALRAVLPSAEIVVLPNLNHLMQPAGTGLPAEYRTIETTLDPEALKTIVDWVAAR